jgi:hypothetical protein
MLDPAAPSSESLVATEPIVVYLSYPPTIALRPGEPATLGLRLFNPTDTDQKGDLSLRVPDGWSIDTLRIPVHLRSGSEQLIELEITPPAPAAVRTYWNPLDLHFNVSGLSWVTSAGMVTTIPWRRWPSPITVDQCPSIPVDAETIEAFGHFQPLPEGTWAYATEFKQPYQATMRYVVQSTGEARIWLNGAEINHHDGQWHVPAIHRAQETGKDIFTTRGWHRITIVVNSEPGELYLANGSGETWDWVRETEWRLPR